MAYDDKIYQLGINYTLAIIGGKWKSAIICQLGIQSQRPLELQRHLVGISPKVLTKQLRQLEADGIVSRTTCGTVPPKVVYGLTAAGRSLRETLVTLSIWGEQMATQSTTPITIIHDSSEIF